METNKIQELVLSFMDSINVKRVQQGESIWRATIPPGERAFFNGFEDYVFTFDRTLAEKHRELELICEGSYLLKKIIERLSSIPKVSRLFARCAPELPVGTPGKAGELRLLTPGKVHYRQQVNFNFRVAFLCDRRQDRLYSLLTDPAGQEILTSTGAMNPDLSQYSEVPDPQIPIEESGEDILRLYLQACQKLESVIEEEIATISSWADQQFEVEKQLVSTYLEEQRRELLKKKENVCFHLYFFQKEEEIDKMIQDLEAEQSRKIQELKDKYQLKVEVSLINAVVICIPTLGIPASKVARRKAEAGHPMRFLGSPGDHGERSALPAL